MYGHRIVSQGEKSNLMEDLDAVVESAIDYVFTKRKYVFDFDHYLRSAKITGPEIKRFIELFLFLFL